MSKEYIRRITDQEICRVMGWQYGYHDTDVTGGLLKRIRDLEKVIRTDEVLAHARAVKRFTEERDRLAAENAELVDQVQLAMPYVLADAKRTLNTYGCADATYREAEQLAKYARAALAKVKESVK